MLDFLRRPPNLWFQKNNLGKENAVKKTQNFVGLFRLWLGPNFGIFFTAHLELKISKKMIEVEKTP